MIKTLRLRNFKAFVDTGDIELKPVTVLAGPNSGGKSTILQSLLLLRQTLETESPDIGLNLDGRFVQFSGLSDLTFGKPRLASCKVGYNLRLDIPIPVNVIPQYYPGVAVPEDSEQLPLQSHISFSFRHKEVEPGKRQVILNDFEMTCLLQGVEGPRMRISFWGKRHRARVHGVQLRKPYDRRKIQEAAFSHFIPLFLTVAPDAEGERPPLLQVDPIFWNPLDDLRDELKTRLRYLGPLREEPQRAYLHSGSPFPEIGQKGEYAAQVLWLEKDDTVHYVPSSGEELRESTLLSAVGDSFQRLGITQPIDVAVQKSIVYQILFGLSDRDGKRQVTIADVGFGVSQLLPIVVMGLRSPEDSLLLFEQPEIHLHPRLQANLADFFLTLAESGKRLVVETHSDHFINRLRRRIAEDSTDALRESISILFVRPGPEGEGATIEPLRVDRYGVIENWPPDFLPESADEAEAIFRAGLDKRGAQ